jgi:hypothetical protein
MVAVLMSQQMEAKYDDIYILTEKIASLIALLRCPLCAGSRSKATNPKWRLLAEDCLLVQPIERLLWRKQTLRKQLQASEFDPKQTLDYPGEGPNFD